MKMKITLQNVGRNKIYKTYEVYPNTIRLQSAIESCEIEALREVKKYLLSNEVVLEPKEDVYSKKNNYVVVVGGFRNVGMVIIEVGK
jgi:hypothetical protein